MIVNQDQSIVGRRKEQAELNEVLVHARNGQGGLLLLRGEAGVGVSTLVETCLAQSKMRILRGRAGETATPAYGLLLQAIRQYLRGRDATEDPFSACGSLRHYLALILPELGPAPESVDRETLFEAVWCALATIAREKPTAVFLDDLQWADNATLELLGRLAASAREEALLLVGAYRSDEVTRGHAIRRLRDELRRGRRLQEIEVIPFTETETAEMLAQILGNPPTPSLVELIYARTQGMPLYIEESAVALVDSGQVQVNADGLAVVAQDKLPLPQTIRDALLIRLDGLSDPARHALEAAAVAGPRHDIDLVIDLLGDVDGLDELFKVHILIETDPGQAAFRHNLMQEAVYEEIPWTRRRELHCAVAARLEATHSDPATIAQHWLAGKAEDEARQAFVVAAHSSCQLHAYRDAALAGQRALSLWPDEGEEAERLVLLDQLGQCAQLSGMLSEAVRAWREAARMRQAAGETRELAEVQRRLAGVLELQGTWDRALTVRQQAADAFAVAGDPAEAAVERLAIATHLQSAGNYSMALEILSQAEEEIAQANQAELQARALGLEGVSLAKLGSIDAGREKVRQGLSLALAENLTSAAAEVYVRLATVAEHAADYAEAIETYEIAYNYCEQNEVSGMANVCLGCLAGVLFRTGEWEQAITLCQEVDEASDHASPMKAVAMSVVGFIYLQQGSFQEAKRLITQAALLARKMEVASIILQTDAALLAIAEQEGEMEVAARYGRQMLAEWERIEERHYVVWSLCGAATFFAQQAAQAEVNACTEALSQIASATGAPDALASLAYALGESALTDGEAGQAAAQFAQSEELFAPLGMPYEHARAQWRAGAAAAAAGDRSAAIDYLFAAYRTARRLGAKPLADEAAKSLLALGEKVDERLGRQAVAELKRAGLTRRQFEVLQLIADGLTNREIADRLVLSTRTVDMHVSNILDRLDCRSRSEAVQRANELGLLD